MINLRQGTLQLDDSSIDQLAAGISCPVRVLSTCVIPPSSETVLPVSLDAEFSAGIVGVIETSQHLMDRYQVQGAAVLAAATADHTVPFRLVNPTGKPVKPYKGQTLELLPVFVATCKFPTLMQRFHSKKNQEQTSLTSLLTSQTLP